MDIDGTPPILKTDDTFDPSAVKKNAGLEAAYADIKGIVDGKPAR